MDDRFLFNLQPHHDDGNVMAAAVHNGLPVWHADMPQPFEIEAHKKNYNNKNKT